MSERKAGIIIAACSIPAFYGACVALAFAEHCSDKDHGWFINMNLFLLCLFGALFAILSAFTFFVGISMAIENKQEGK